MTLAFAVFTKLCDLANELARMREPFPPHAPAALFLDWIVQDLDAWIDLLVHTDGIVDTPEPQPGDPGGHNLCRFPH